MDHPETVVAFMEFLQSPDEVVEAAITKYEGDHWRIQSKTLSITWPKQGSSFSFV
jgi:hypothetical protein